MHGYPSQTGQKREVRLNVSSRLCDALTIHLKKYVVPETKPHFSVQLYNLSP
uniref:Uncharacterized protein n=1 Tax=Arion vulgaris TaxID=1028688 RepID=A0A0B7ATZ8_9EUPU